MPAQTNSRAVCIAKIGALAVLALGQAANVGAQRDAELELARPGESAEAFTLRGWQALRAMDCARCHGRNYAGASGPDLVAAVRDGPRERFNRFVLEGDINRGMPGYKSQPFVVSEMDAMYAYLRLRADGRVGTGRPVAVPALSATEP